MAMRALGMVVMVSALTGSYGAAGVAAGLCTGAQAVASPQWARLTHRLDVQFVTAASGILVALWSALTIIAAHHSIMWVYVTATLLGASALPIGAVTRALWTSLLEPEDINAAFALEGIQDEIAYVAGPALVVALDVTLFAGAGLAAAAVLHLAGNALVGFQATRLGQGLRDTATDPGPRALHVLRRDNVAPLVVSFALVGMFFGALDVGLVARAEHEGFAEQTGWLLSVLALGSTVAGIIYGQVAATLSRRRVYLLGTALLALSLLPLTAWTTPLPIAVNLALAGLLVSPVLISANELLVALVDTKEIVIGLAILSSSITVGLALGSAAGGGLADSQGSSASFILASAGAGVAFAVMALTSQVRGRRPPEETATH